MLRLLLPYVRLSIFGLGLLAYSLPVCSYPAAEWRTRSVKNVTVDGCIKKAGTAMRQVGLQEIALSGQTGMKGHYLSTVVFILCFQKPQNVIATIFCADDPGGRNDHIALCDRLAQYMEK